MISLWAGNDAMGEFVWHTAGQVNVQPKLHSNGAVECSQLTVYSGGSEFYIVANNAIATGKGCDLLRPDSARAVGIAGRVASGADSVSTYLAADVNASSINDQHIVTDFGWVADDDAWTSGVTVRACGAIGLTAIDADSAPTGAAGQIGYSSNGDAGSPCFAVHNGTSWLRVALGAAIASS
jgi:hypothetical protein